jgi:tetratricopeptide (TPR) repeat protein
VNEVVPLLKHSPSAQDPKVLEEITVQREPLVAALVEAALDVDGGSRHQLLIGPRGIGKTHILTLVASRLRAEEKRQPLAVAWLVEDPWQIRSYEKFLAEIIGRLADDLDDPALAARSEEIRAGGNDAALEGEQLLRDAAGNARLVLLVENLDEIFRRIGDEGQARFRAFAEDWRRLLIIATAPQLFEGVQLHESPFYGFFAITHLEELSLASARELMRRIAEMRGDSKLVEFLRTDVATRRLAAIEALAGGHPRVWLLLSGCVSIEAIDDLVPLFLEALDDLTPYYQARLRELGDQQQELVVILGEAGGALSNRELAERSGLAQNQVATLVRQLDHRGYIRRATVPREIAGGDERMSYWELREPLMRLCLDVKQSQGEPLRMVVEFLRAWYGPRLLDELVTLPVSARLAATYVTEALRSFDGVFTPDDLLKGTPSEIIARAERGLSLLPDRFELRLAKAAGLRMEGRLEEAEEDYERLTTDMIAVYEKQPDDPLLAELAGMVMADLGRSEAALAILPHAIELNPDNAELSYTYAGVLSRLDRHAEALDALDRAIDLNPEDADAHSYRGAALAALDRLEEALAAVSRAHELDPESSTIQLNRGSILAQLGRYEEAVEPFRAGLERFPDEPKIWNNLGGALINLERPEEALEALRRGIELDPDNAHLHSNLGIALMELERYEEAVDALTKAVEIDPDGAMAWANLGSSLGNSGRYEEAAECFAKALELAPGVAELLKASGIVFERLGRAEEALQAFTEAAELEPQEAELHSYRADLLRDTDELVEAERAIERAIELDPEEPLYRFTRAEIGFMRDEDEAALAELREALSLWSQDRHGPAGAPELIMQSLWRRHQAGEEVGPLAVELVKLYDLFEAAEDLGRALVETISLVVAPDVTLESARSWLAAWGAAPESIFFEIPIEMLRATVAWKKDRDRSHLLALPQEQREILTGLLADGADGP